jgi:hypothetical protein
VAGAVADSCIVRGISWQVFGDVFVWVSSDHGFHDSCGEVHVQGYIRGKYLELLHDDMGLGGFVSAADYGSKWWYLDVQQLMVHTNVAPWTDCSKMVYDFAKSRLKIRDVKQFFGDRYDKQTVDDLLRVSQCQYVCLSIGPMFPSPGTSGSERAISGSNHVSIGYQILEEGCDDVIPRLEGIVKDCRNAFEPRRTFDLLYATYERRMRRVDVIRDYFYERDPQYQRLWLPDDDAQREAVCERVSLQDLDEDFIHDHSDRILSLGALRTRNDDSDGCHTTTLLKMKSNDKKRIDRIRDLIQQCRERPLINGRVYVTQPYEGLGRSPHVLLIMELLVDRMSYVARKTRPCLLYDCFWHITQQSFWLGPPAKIMPCRISDPDLGSVEKALAWRRSRGERPPPSEMLSSDVL